MNLMATRSWTDPLAARVHESRQRARHYLLARQSPSGGFCFYRTEYLDEPNLFDTWHAVAALKLLGELPLHREMLVGFVCAQAPCRQPYALYYRTFTLDALGSPDPDQAVSEENVCALPLNLPSPAPHSDLTEQLERLLLTLRLKAHFGLVFVAEDIARSIRRLEQPQGGFGVPPNLQDTHLALAILELCGQTASQFTAAFVAGLAQPSYAFRLTEDSLSPNLETVCDGIACCGHLDLSVAYPDAAAGFILGCQAGNGGFARAPDALPDIRLSHVALEGLATLFDSPPIPQ